MGKLGLSIGPTPVGSSRKTIATLNDGKMHPIYDDTIVWLGKPASVGLKVPYYIVTSWPVTTATLEDNSPLSFLEENVSDAILGEPINYELNLSKNITTVDVDYSLSFNYTYSIPHFSEKLTYLTLVCDAEMEGEYICNISLDGEVYKLGIQAVGENEILKINLQNKGVEIPNAISKAIYETNVEQDAPDFVVLNKKWKELYINYMELMAGKGNYKQLANSLKWFEYGDKVEMKELWRVNTLDGPRYHDHKIKPVVDNELREIMKNSAKSTFITLTHIPSPERDVNPSENTIDDLTKKWEWSKEMMRSKMYLLGAFFETYFMPVHMNVLFSTVEDIYRDLIDEMQGLRITHCDLVENVVGDTHVINITANSNSDDGIFQFEEVSGFMFWSKDGSDNELPFGLEIDEIGAKPMLGFIKAEDAPEDNNPVNTIGVFNGPAAIIPVTVTIPDRYNDADGLVGATIQLTTNLPGETVTRELVVTEDMVEVDGKSCSIKFNLATQYEGVSRINVVITKPDASRTYIGSLQVETVDESYIDLRFFNYIWSWDKWNNNNAILDVDYDFITDAEGKSEKAPSHSKSQDYVIAFSTGFDTYTYGDDGGETSYSPTKYFHVVNYAGWTGNTKESMSHTTDENWENVKDNTGICAAGFWATDSETIYNSIKAIYNEKQLVDSWEYWIGAYKGVAEDGSDKYFITAILEPAATDEESLLKSIGETFGMGKMASYHHIFLPYCHDLVEVKNNEKVDKSTTLTIVSPFVNLGGETVLLYTYPTASSNWIFNASSGTKLGEYNHVRSPFIINTSVFGQVTVTLNWQWSKNGNMKSISKKSPIFV